MVSPTTKEVVSGRFGKFRGGGTGNFGSANAAPHMHDGLDFSTSGKSQPLYATTEGVVTWAGLRGSAGNTIMIRRGSGDIVAYYHLSALGDAIKVGATVTVGQVIGVSGNTPSGAMAKHLHFVYGVAKKDLARAKSFSEDSVKGPFDPSQLPPVFNRSGDIGYKTDPSPFFCKTYPIHDGHPEHHPILGKDTKEQFSILFGSVPSGGTPPDVKFDAVQVAAANSDAALAEAMGVPVATFMGEDETFGSLPSAPLGGYDTMSTSEMMLTEATRRFSDSEWNKNVTKIAARALWVDYTRAIGVSNFLAHEIYRKKERIEALMAVYVSQKMAKIKDQTRAARDRAERNNVQRAIN